MILMDPFGPDNFSTLQIKGHVLHRARAHFKVPGWLLVWNALLTKKLPMFLSRLNEISGGCEKILPVSGSFWSNLKFFRMMDLTAWLWGWNVRVNGIRSHRRSTTVSLETYPLFSKIRHTSCSCIFRTNERSLAWITKVLVTAQHLAV